MKGRWHVRPALGLCLLALALVVQSACTRDDPAPAANPLFNDSPRPADSQSYPNLSTVPPRPDDLPSAEERARIREDLERDRTALRDAAGE